MNGVHHLPRLMNGVHHHHPSGEGMSSTVQPITILPRRASLESPRASQARVEVDPESQARVVDHLALLLILGAGVDRDQESRARAVVVLFVIKNLRVKKKEEDYVSYYHGHLKHGTLMIMTLKKFGYHPHPHLMMILHHLARVARVGIIQVVASQARVVGIRRALVQASQASLVEEVRENQARAVDIPLRENQARVEEEDMERVASRLMVPVASGRLTRVPVASGRLTRGMVMMDGLGMHGLHRLPFAKKRRITPP